jgi:hypothetical protein
MALAAMPSTCGVRCYHGRPAPLDEEAEFFQRRMGRSAVLTSLLERRRAYHPSFAFVVRGLTTLVRLHARSACDSAVPAIAHDAFR